MKKILVTAVGGDVGYAVIKALKDSVHNLFIIGCDVRKYTMSSDILDDFFVCPRYDDANYWTRYMLDFVCQEGIDYFWPITESEIKIVNDNKELFESTRVIINQPNIIKIALDKGETARFLDVNGILTPKTWESIPADTTLYPLIVKERFSCGSQAVVLVNNKDELADSFCKMSDPIVQEYVGDISDEYTLSIFSDGYVTNKIAFKRELGFDGMSKFVELVNDTKLLEIADKISNIFNLHGSINVQLRKNNGNYYVFEINPRISSTMGFRRLLGFNDVSWWLDLVEQKSIEQYVIPNKKIFGVRTVEEKIFSV